MYFFLSFFFLASFIHSQEKEDELLFVHVHFRHGARSPMSINEKGLDDSIRKKNGIHSRSIFTKKLL